MISITGYSGLVGKEFLKHNKQITPLFSRLENYDDILTELKLRKPKVIIHAAANVGGLGKNINNNLQLFEDNITMNINLLHAITHIPDHTVDKVVCFLSTCIYPNNAFYPLIESDIQNGPPHDSNYGYAYAKRMLTIQGKAISRSTETKVISVVPNNLYGLNDNYDLENGHVIPSVIHKVFLAKQQNLPEVEFWGDGTPMREFTYAGDIPKIIDLILEKYNDYDEPINIGNTKEYSIKQVVEMICKIMDYSGTIRWNTDKPNGQFRKPSSNEKLLSLVGWDNKKYTTLEKGLKLTCKHFIDNYPNLRGVK